MTIFRSACVQLICVFKGDSFSTTNPSRFDWLNWFIPFVCRPRYVHPSEHLPMAIPLATKPVWWILGPIPAYHGRWNTSASTVWMRAVGLGSSFPPVWVCRRWSTAAIRTAMDPLVWAAALAGPAPILALPWRCSSNSWRHLRVAWHRILCSWCLVFQA